MHIHLTEIKSAWKQKRENENFFHRIKKNNYSSHELLFCQEVKICPHPKAAHSLVESDIYQNFQNITVGMQISCGKLSLLLERSDINHPLKCKITGLAF